MSTARVSAATTPGDGDNYARIRNPRLGSWIRIIGVGVCLLWVGLNVWNIPNNFLSLNKFWLTDPQQFSSALVNWKIAPEIISAYLVGIASVEALAYCFAALLVIWKRPFDPVA